MTKKLIGSRQQNQRLRTKGTFMYMLRAYITESSNVLVSNNATKTELTFCGR